jgi:tetratricopeptide (TPR) repeat protein
MGRAVNGFKRVRLAAGRIGHAVWELPDWTSGGDPDYQAGEALLRLGKHAEAERCLLKAASTPRSVARQVRVLMALAEAQWKLEKLSEARESAESARALLAGRRKPSSELANCLDLLASIAEKEENAEEARRLLREAVEIESKASPLDPVLLTQRYRRLAKAIQNESESEARELVERAVETAERRLGGASTITADCLMDLGQLQVAKGETEIGVASMERAVEIHGKTHGHDSEEVARDLQRLASACHAAGDLERAVHYYQRALAIRERQVGGDTADVAILLMGLADAQSLRGNDTPALELLQQAVSKLSTTGDEHLSWALESLGVSYHGAGRFDDAVSCYRKARALWEKNPKANREILEANALRLEEAMRYAPPENVPNVPIFVGDWTSSSPSRPSRLSGAPLNRPASRVNLLRIQHREQAPAEPPAGNGAMGSVPQGEADPSPGIRLVLKSSASETQQPSPGDSSSEPLTVLPIAVDSGTLESLTAAPISAVVLPARSVNPTTGASSGGGNPTAELAAAHGASVQPLPSQPALRLTLVIPDADFVTPGSIETNQELTGWSELAFDFRPSG